MDNLLTNVPLDETIGILMDMVYRSEKTPLPIPENLLRDLLKTCTTEAPFRCHRGHLYQQRDGVSMGSPMGVLFAEAYMSEVEKRTFQHQTKPNIYARFRDDIFVSVNNSDEIDQLSETLTNHSVLGFTIERSHNRQLPYLDAMVMQNDNRFQTKVYVKKTNVGRCLNARSECPDSYKRSVVAAYAKRALTHTTTWGEMHCELERVRQMLTNNGFRDDMIESVISSVLNKYSDEDATSKCNTNRIVIPHCMTYGTNFQPESDTVRRIVKHGVSPVDSQEEVTLRIYCRPNLTASLIMKNSNTPKPALENETNVVYRFECTVGACRGRKVDYIGLTTTTLRKRMENHRYNGAISGHFKNVHERRPTTNELLQNSTILHRVQNFQRLAITEAVCIELRKPLLNI